VKGNGLVGAMERRSVRGGEVDWVQAYERRMRRFNLAVILAALTALTILIASFAFSLSNMIEAFWP
jgi:hypothetical protein